MKCDICKEREATVHLTEVINDRVTKLHLCEECAREKGVDVCAFCGQFPCARVLGVAKGYPTLIADAERMKELGIDAWIEEQEARATTGFAYLDIRCYPYEVPKD